MKHAVLSIRFYRKSYLMVYLGMK